MWVTGKKLLIPILLFAFSFHGKQMQAQFGKKFYDSTEVYFVQPYLSAGYAVLGLTGGALTVDAFLNRDIIATDRLLDLKINDVNSFDRFALKQDPNLRDNRSKQSDIWRNVGIATPLLLAFEKDVRGQWLDVVLMYTEAHALNVAVYGFGPFGPRFIERLRPIAYYDEVPIDQRAKARNRNSFFSGHTSTSAVGPFFTAKVLSDLHPEWGAKRILLFAAAAIPPAMVGYFRVVSLNHFPIDTMIGFAVGAFSGILIPHLHKRRQNKFNMILGYGNNAMSFSARWKI